VLRRWRVWPEPYPPSVRTPMPAAGGGRCGSSGQARG
jgi:hypothetical protein